MGMREVKESKDMKYKVGDRVVLREFNKDYKTYKSEHSFKIATISKIREWGELEPDYMLDVDNGRFCWEDVDIDHKETQKLHWLLYGKFMINVSEIMGANDGLLNHNFKQAELKRVIPNRGDQYFYVDLADENLYGIGYWNGDATDYHMVKLGLIKDTAQACVKVAKEMLKKLELEV